jgi:hypothetical protein
MGNPNLRAPKTENARAEPGVLKVGRPGSDSKARALWEATEATRYLCATAYLNGRFRGHVIRQLVEERHNALAVSYGIDPVAVLKHCLAARRLDTIRTLLLTVCVLLAVVAYLLTPSLPAASLLLWFVSLLVAWTVIAWHRWRTEFQIVRGQCSKGLFDRSHAPPCQNREAEEACRQVEHAQGGNVMIYSGFSPFVGCGTNIGGWSFAVDGSLGKAQMGGYLQPKSFHIRDVYQTIGHMLRTLNLPNCTLEDKVCISGLDVRGDEKFLPEALGRPVTKIDTSSMGEYVANSSTTARHYQNFRLVDWSGELILNAFLHFSHTAHNLFVEVTYCLLVPLDERYRWVDSLNPVPTWRDWLRLLVVSGLKAVFIWPAWLGYLFQLLNRPIAKWLRQHEKRKMVQQNPAYDHGAHGSLREHASSSGLYRRYFQKLDKEMYVKILEGQILDTLVGFLDERDIDTSLLKEMQSRIINSGIIVSGGGTVEAHTLPVGRGSTSVTQESPSKSYIRFIRNLVGKTAQASH